MGISYTFTNCGQSGRFGPSDTQIMNAYKGTNLEGKVYPYNGMQIIGLSPGTYNINVVGARGGITNDHSVGSSHTGNGARMNYEVVIDKATAFVLLIGQAGTNVAAGDADAGGGGGSFVAKIDPTSSHKLLNEYPVIPFLIAGGGGGTGSDSYYKDAFTTQVCTGNNNAGYGCTSYNNGGGGFYSNGKDRQTEGGGRGFLQGGIGGRPGWGAGGFGGGSAGVNEWGAGGGGYTGGPGYDSNYYGGAGSYFIPEAKQLVISRTTGTGHGYVTISTEDGHVFQTNGKIDVDDLTFNTPVHKEPVQIEGIITTGGNTKAGYKIFVGDTQIIPPNNRPCVKYDTPYNILELIPGELLEIGENTISIHLEGEDGMEGARDFKVIRENDSPSITIETSANSIHKENISIAAHLADTELDLAKFKVEIGDKQFYPETGWSDYQQTPYIFNYAISNGEFKVGENVIKITCQDIHGAETIVTKVINKTDEKPVLGDIKVQGKTISSYITDAEEDAIRYQIWVNDFQVFPSSGWTKFMATPYNLIYTLPNSQVNIGDVNKIEVLVEDELGEVSKWTTFIVIDYVGLMFTDIGGSFYSNDIGEILKRLEVDTVIAGEDSKTYPLWLKNTTGFKMKNVVVYPKQRDLDEIDERVLLSITEIPFESKKELKLPINLSPGDSCKFFVRVETSLSALGGGVFELWTEGEPYEIEVNG